VNIIVDWLRQRLTRMQIIRFAISLVLATLLWGWVTQLQDPRTNQQFNSIPITVNGLSDSMFLVTTLPRANITLSGPSSRIDEINAADIALSIDLSDISEPGEYQVKLDVSKPDGVNTRRLEPRELQIQVEELVSKVFPLEAVDTLPEDDPREISSTSMNVSQVTVTGPSSAMNRVQKVVVPIAVNQQTADFQQLFEPYAVDAEGQRINEVTILPAQVSTFVELETRGKEVSVIPVVTGSPAEGYSVQQKASIPETILVDGPAAELETLLFVNTEPIDITGATQSISTMAEIDMDDLPEGVTIVEPADGTVEVRVAIEDTTNTSQAIPSLPVEIVDLDPALAASVDPTTVGVTIDAPQSILQSLAADDIKVWVSVAGLGPGTYTLEPNVSVPEGVTLVSGETSAITVTITDPRASPGASPESTGG
jgi:YbbR domain-containing protein